jgi:hypothetical protein
MDYKTWFMVNRLWSIIHTKTPDGEAEGFTAVGVRMVFYQRGIICGRALRCTSTTKTKVIVVVTGWEAASLRSADVILGAIP